VTYSAGGIRFGIIFDVAETMRNNGRRNIIK
jgi:hypothetical protein